MKSASISIAPASNLRRKVTLVGSVIVCRSGAQGYRLHWEEPSAGVDPGATSEVLVNGQAYFSPNDKFRAFWITTGGGGGSIGPQDQLELRVIDLAAPVVLLNPNPHDGFRTNLVATASVGLLANPGTANIYTTTAAQAVADDIPRGWIGGGISAATPFVARVYARLDVTDNTYLAELAVWAVTALDGNARYSCSFESGGRSAFAAGTNTNNGPGLLAWPYYGLRLSISTNGAVNVTDALWQLSARTEA